MQRLGADSLLWLVGCFYRCCPGVRVIAREEIA